MTDVKCVTWDHLKCIQIHFLLPDTRYADGGWASHAGRYGFTSMGATYGPVCLVSIYRAKTVSRTVLS